MGLCARLPSTRPGGMREAMNPAAAFRPARCVGLRPEGQGLITANCLPAELRGLRAFRRPLRTQMLLGPFLASTWPQDGPSCLQVASYLPSCLRCCRQVASRCLRRGLQAVKMPSWAHLGPVLGSKMGILHRRGYIFQHVAFSL